MGTTRIKVIDLSGQQQEIKTSRKHAQKLAGPSRLDRPVETDIVKLKEEKPATTEGTELKPENTEKKSVESAKSSVPSAVTTSVPSVIKNKSATVKPSVPIVVARRHKGKKYLNALKLVDKNKLYPAKEAIDLLYKTSTSNFEPTVEAHLNIIDKNVRSSINFPHPIGPKKAKKYLIFSDQQLFESEPQSRRLATSNQQLIWGNENTIKDIAAGKLKPHKNFDQVFASPKVMPQLAKVAKILGPHGLMPNPKNGTIITQDPQEFVQGLLNRPETGYDLKIDPTAPIIHTKLGKLSAKPQQLEENLKALIAAVGPTKIKKAVISSTMGPAIKVDPTTISR